MSYFQYQLSILKRVALERAGAVISEGHEQKLKDLNNQLKHAQAELGNILNEVKSLAPGVQKGPPPSPPPPPPPYPSSTSALALLSVLRPQLPSPSSLSAYHDREKRERDEYSSQPERDFAEAVGERSCAAGDSGKKFKAEVNSDDKAEHLNDMFGTEPLPSCTPAAVATSGRQLTSSSFSHSFVCVSADLSQDSAMLSQEFTEDDKHQDMQTYLNCVESRFHAQGSDGSEI